MAHLDKVFKEISVKKVPPTRPACLGSRDMTPLTIAPRLTIVSPPQLYKDLFMIARLMGRRVSTDQQLQL
jgi:hypothetical protein